MSKPMDVDEVLERFPQLVGRAALAVWSVDHDDDAWQTLDETGPIESKDICRRQAATVIAMVFGAVW